MYFGEELGMSGLRSQQLDEKQKDRCETGKTRIRKKCFIIELVMGMKSVFSDLGFSFCRYFRLLSLHYRMWVFIQTVGKLQDFFGLGGCGYFFLNTWRGTSASCCLWCQLHCLKSLMRRQLDATVAVRGHTVLLAELAIPVGKFNTYSAPA